MLRGEGYLSQMRKQEDMKTENLIPARVVASDKLQEAGMGSLSILLEVIQEISGRGRQYLKGPTRKMQRNFYKDKGEWL